MLIKITEHPQIIETDGITQDKAKELFRSKALLRLVATDDSLSPVTMKQISEVTEASWKMDMGGKLGELPSNYKVDGYLPFENIPGHVFETTLGETDQYATYISDFRKVSIKKYEDSENVVISRHMYETEVTKPCPTTVITGDHIVPLYMVAGAVFSDERKYGLRYVDKIVLPIKGVEVKLSSTIEAEKALNGHTAVITLVPSDDYSLVYKVDGHKIHFEVIDKVIHIKTTQNELSDSDAKAFIKRALKPKDKDIAKYINKVLQNSVKTLKEDERSLMTRISEERTSLVLKYKNLDDTRTEIQRIANNEVTANIKNPHIEEAWIEEGKLVFTTVLLNVQHTPSEEDTAYSIRLGRFHVTIDMNTGKVNALNMTRRVNSYWDNACSFHISNKGEPCLGTFADIATEAIGLCRYEELIDMSIGMICSINEEDYAGKQWYKWLEGSEADKHNSHSVKCAKCGNKIDTEEGDYLEVGYDTYCQDCHTSCPECGELGICDEMMEYDDEYYCNECVVECGSCGSTKKRDHLVETEDRDILCPDCASSCGNCGGVHSKKDMAIIDGVPYCQACYSLCDGCGDQTASGNLQ